MSRLTFWYPEADSSEVVGRFIRLGRVGSEQVIGVLPTEGQFVNGAWAPAGQPLKFDPRCVVTNEVNLLVYNPRAHAAELDERYRAWLYEHPDWPGELGSPTVVELTR
jgi:hypothetical protein